MQKDRYVVKDVYTFLKDLTTNNVLFYSLLVWNKLVPLKISSVRMSIVLHILPIKNNLISKGINQIDSRLCVEGCELNKTVQHFFFVCLMFRCVDGILGWLDFLLCF